MAVNKIDGLINGLVLFDSVMASPITIEVKGYMVRIPDARLTMFDDTQVESLLAWGWASTTIKDRDGVPMPEYEGFIFGGDV